MGEIVWNSCVSHTAAMLRMPEGTDEAQANKVFAAFEQLRQSLIESRPDMLVVIATDHMMTFSYDVVPIFAVGVGDEFPVWGEAGTPKRTFKGPGAVTFEIVESLIRSDFDVVAVGEMRLDHAFNCPLSFIMRGVDIPLLPVYVNCTTPPLPSHARCKLFGDALGDSLRAQTKAQRIAVLGTGGLSHWVGLPQTGLINERFDRDFLKMFEAGELDPIVALDSEKVVAEAGNGAAEIRNWLIAAAAGKCCGGKRLAYEAVAAWKTGIGIVELSV